METINFNSTVNLILGIIALGMQIYIMHLKKKQTKHDYFLKKFKRNAEHIRRAVLDEDTIDVNILLNDLVRDAALLEKKGGLLRQILCKVKKRGDGGEKS